LLRLPRGAAVLDVGCAFGHGTALLARRFQVEGIDPSPDYIARARRRYPWIPFSEGKAESLPYASDRFDGVVLLDVLEHLPPASVDQALGEVARVLRPDGVLVLSTPNAGLLAAADSLNAYMALCGPDAPLAETFALRGEPAHHRHYSAATLRAALAGHGLLTDEVIYSGLGLAEGINLILLLALWRPRKLHRLYDALQYLYYGAYIAEDILSLGRFSYHMTVRARRHA
jgi:SAM-dependent methyltransferase